MDTPLYGYLAEFDDPDVLTEAAQRLRGAGFKCLDAFTPYPVESVARALGYRHSWVPLLTLGGGLTGGVVGFLLQYWANGIAYPLHTEGMPLLAWPAFIPITFELTILFAALTAAGSMFLVNRLPQPYHPVFNAPEFTRASQDQFFLLVEARDAHFHPHDTRLLLIGLGALKVSDVLF